jgi:hypothetical protein
VLPASAIELAGTDVTESKGRYSAGVWRNADPDGEGPRQREWPDLPADLLCMNGHEGQYCVVFPSERIVVVRLGCTKQRGFDIHGLLRAVRDAVRR